MTATALVSVDLDHDEGVVLARRRARDVSRLVGFDVQTGTRLATAVSELARNAHRYAGGGRVLFGLSADALEVQVVDHGPGITDLDAVLAGARASDRGQGRGLLGVRRLVDDLRIDTAPTGTRVLITKRLPLGPPLRPEDLRVQLDQRGPSTPYEEVTQQNQELLLALGELRARQDELVALNRELDDTNRGVVALYSELDDRAELLRDADERKSRFLADMSHELRTPLNSIVALTELLLDPTAGLHDEATTQVGFIRRMADDQLRLVGDLLDIAKIEAGRLEVDIREVGVSELLAVLRAQLRPLVTSDALALRFTAEPGLAPILTDELKLTQVLRNLISNALKFTPRGVVAVDVRRAGSGVVFAVRDTGVGMSAEDLDRVFDEFVQVPGVLQEHGKGTGLGLPLARKLSEVLGGTLGVTSEVGSGTTFELALPAVSGAPIDPARAAATVLLVDDEEPVRYVLREHLRGSRFAEVREAASGAAALAACATTAPAAIVLDVQLPDMDGREVLRRLRDRPHLRDVPVVVHSSHELTDALRATLAEHGARWSGKERTTRQGLLDLLGGEVRRGD